MKDRFLPIGTIVLLKNGKKEIMITSYGVMPEGTIIVNGKEEDGGKKMFEYGGCTYPEGFISPENIICFNHSNIEKVCYMGYETDAFNTFNKGLNEMFDKIKKEEGKE